MALNVDDKHYIRGRDLLKTKWNLGDEVVYNSDPEDVGNEYLHLNYGQIENIFINDKKKHMIHIKLPYGKITMPLFSISLQFIPQKEENIANNFKNDDNDCKEMVTEQVFVYGLLRDDIDNISNATKRWTQDCFAQSGRLYGFKLFKERYEDYPFAIKTADNNDYINGRLISWNGKNVFQQKLEIADKMKNINWSNTKRDFVHVLNANGDLVEAIAYYKDTKIEELNFYERLAIPDGDWLKRDRERDLSEYNPSIPILSMLKKIIICKEVKPAFGILHYVYLVIMCFQKDELIDALPLPPESLEERLSSSDDDNMDQKISNEWEYFRISGDNMAIMNDNKTIKKFRQSIHTAYGKYIASCNNNNVYKWTFKVVVSGTFVIGIASKILLTLNEPFYKFEEEFENYAFDIFNCRKVTRNSFSRYGGSKAKSNDVITMELNMKQRTLCYYMNGKYQGLAFENIVKNKRTCYQMAVSIQQHGDEISLKNFQIYPSQ